MGGGTIVLFNDTQEDIGYAFVRGNGGALRSQVLLPCKPACFVDMRDTTDPLLLTRQPVWFEAGIQRMIPAKNFDAIVWVRNIHPARLPLGTLLVYSGFPYRRQLTGVGLASVLALILAVGLLVRQRLSRSSSAVDGSVDPQRD